MPLQAGQAYVELIPRLAPGFQSKVAEELAPSGAAAGESFLTGFSSKLEGASARLSSIGTKLTTHLTLPLLAAGGVAIHYAADLDHSISAANTIFTDHAKVIIDFAKKAAGNIGLAEGASIDWSNKLGQMFHAMGFTSGAAATMSTSIQGVAADLGSLRNIGTDEALDKITKAMAGQYRGLKSLGVVLDANMVKQKAQEMGLYSGTGALDNNARSQAVLALITDQSSVAHGQFAKHTKDVGEQSRIMQAKLKDAADELGQHLLPIGLQILKWAGDLFDGFRKLGPEGQKVALILAGVAAAAGPVAKSLSGVFKIGALAADNPILAAVLIIAGAIALVAFHWKELVNFFQTDGGIIAGALLIAFAPLLGALLPIIAIGIGIGALVDNFDKVKKAVEDAAAATLKWLNDTGIIDTLRQAFADVVAWIEQAGSDISDWWESNVSPVWGKFQAAAETAFGIIAGIIGTALGIASDLWDTFGSSIMDGVNTVATYIGNIFSTAFDFVASMVGGLFDFIQGIVEGALQILGGIFDVFVAIFSGNWDGLWNGITEIVGGVWDVIVSYVNIGINTVLAVINAFIGVVSAVWNALWSGIGAVVDFIWSGISATVNAVTGFILGVVNGFASAFSAAWSGLWNGLKGAVDAVAGPIVGAFNNIVGFIKGIWNDFVGAWNDFHVSIDIPSVDLGPLGEIGGGTIAFSLPSLPKLHTGGIIPGFAGSDVPILGAAGEGVFTADQMAALAPVGAGGRDVTLNIELNGGTVLWAQDLAAELGEPMREVLLRLERIDGPALTA